MRDTISQKIQTYLGQQAIYKDKGTTDNLFAGRNLPSFVKDYLIKRYARGEQIDRAGLNNFLDTVMPKGDIRSKLIDGQEITLLTRFNVNINLIKGVRQFGIIDLGIKENEGVIPDHVANKHVDDLHDGEMWGIIKLCLLPDEDGKKNHVTMVDFKPFKPYTSVDISFIQNVRRNFSMDEWLDLVISAMEYEPDSFANMHQKLEFVTRLLVFVEPRLNMVELAPKGTGKSFVFNNISKYGWLVSGGKVTRASLFYDKNKKQKGLLGTHDFCAFDEVQTIEFQEPAELQGALKSYLEQGKASIGNVAFTSEAGLMLMGNIGLTSDQRPRSPRYFDELPENFKESALIDRFHGFVEGWFLPKIQTNMIYKGWTMNMEYFSEVMHNLRVQNAYAEVFDKIVDHDPKAGVRDVTAVKRMAVGYMKLLFPHWTTPEEVNLQEFDTFCLQPAINRRGIIRQQLHLIDPEFKPEMPNIWVKQ